MTKDEFINKTKTIHNGKYDYSKVEYKNNRTKVCIICPEHGEFWQRPDTHLQGCGCPKCGTKLTSQKNNFNTETFITKANNVHNNKYDYYKSEYNDINTKICIICPEHGEFWQSPNNHLRGQGCPKCKDIKTSLRCRSTTEEFIRKAKEIHDDKYDYSKVKYVNNITKICIICPEHGEFWQVPNSHLQGCGCKKCANEKKSLKRKYNNEIFVNKSNLKHNFVFDYSMVNYVNSRTKVCIICPEHGEFWQSPEGHLQGKGCPKCNSSHLENEVRNLLIENGFDFEEQKKFEWLGKLRLDFYLPNDNIAIECQGKQHFEPIEHFGGQETLTEVIQRDQNKKQLCEEHNINLLYYANYDYDFPYEVFTNKNKLLNEIIWKRK